MSLYSYKLLNVLFSVRGDIHTQVATRNVNMTFGGMGVGFADLLMLEWWQNDIILILMLKQLYHNM